ncbi:MAG: hypothetical protein V7L05_20395 [Nostoc sp.]|uniref:hypothetical protein n=1 Tax=Nostoc sp. TaxID=1180 RepID=UPI002FFA8BD7
MSKLRKKQGNPDFRHQVTCPAPTSQEIESRLLELLTPGTFANLKGVKDKERSLRVGVARRLYFFHRARCRRRATPTHNSQLQLIPWLVEHQRSMGLVNAIPQRHRRNASRSLYIWAEALT